VDELRHRRDQRQLALDRRLGARAAGGTAEEREDDGHHPKPSHDDVSFSQ
jgi:hypothetical protein